MTPDTIVPSAEESSDGKKQRFELALEEYRLLKEEQLKRIGFRDSVVYFTIVALGTVASWAGPTNPGVLFVVPLLLVILGWAYLMNDQKVSAIGDYIRGDLRRFLIENLSEDLREAEEKQARVFAWEFSHRSDSGRRSRKIFQLIVDQLAFVVPGLACLAYYAYGQKPLGMFSLVLIACETILLLFLSIQIWLYADLRRDG